MYAKHSKIMIFGLRHCLKPNLSDPSSKVHNLNLRRDINSQSSKMLTQHDQIQQASKEYYQHFHL
jgi:hypothetical protein